MSLNLYLKKEDCPLDIVQNNDAYFAINSKIPDTSEARQILDYVDNADYFSDSLFTSRYPYLGTMSGLFLSTGAKTLLNVLQHPDECFTLIECGSNALRLMHLFKEGNVYCPKFGIYVDGDPSCDIICNGKHFSRFMDLVNYVYDLEV